jgi:hypothetical protein
MLTRIAAWVALSVSHIVGVALTKSNAPMLKEFAQIAGITTVSVRVG